MNRATFALDLLRKHGIVTNGFIADNYRERVFCWRNSVAEAKKLLPKGYEIVANMRGRDWKAHYYRLTLKEAPVVVQDGQREWAL